MSKRTKPSALAQLCAIHIRNGMTTTKALAEETGYTERQIWRAKRELATLTPASVSPASDTLTPTSVTEPQNLTPASVTQPRVRARIETPSGLVIPKGLSEDPPLPPKGGSGRDFWAKAINPDPEHGHDKVAFVDGKLTLFNGCRAEWLAAFGGDATALDLALREVAGRVQPSSHARPLVAQVESQLARIARTTRDSDKRYRESVARNAKANGPKKSAHLARY